MVYWSLKIFYLRSYFQFLTHSLNTTSFHLDKPIWKSKVPSKVKSFIWTVVLNRINTNDILQVRRPHKAISPYVFVMCGANSESVSHLFLHCPVADFLCNFGTVGECWVCPARGWDKRLGVSNAQQQVETRIGKL